MKSLFSKSLLLLALASALVLPSCINPYAGTNEVTGGVLGAVGGGAVGGIIGNQSGRGLEGAAIGSVLGAVAGSAIGRSSDTTYYGSPYRYRYYPPQTRYYSYPSYGYSSYSYPSYSYYPQTRYYSYPSYGGGYCAPHYYRNHCW